MVLLIVCKIQLYLISGLSFGQEIDNGTLSENGLGVHYDFGGGVNIPINDKWTLNYDFVLKTIKHQSLPAELFIKTGIDIGYQITA